MRSLVTAAAVALLSLSTLVVADPATTLTQDEFIALTKQEPKVIVLDVRTPEEFAAGHIPGARNIPHDQLPNRLAELAGAKDKDVVVYCRSGRRSAIAQEILEAQGFKRVRHLEGDMLKWEEAKRPVEK